jgi:hypothetical protein
MRERRLWRAPSAQRQLFLVAAAQQGSCPSQFAPRQPEPTGWLLRSFCHGRIDHHKVTLKKMRSLSSMRKRVIWKRTDGLRPLVTFQSLPDRAMSQLV